jgi:four helix bundle protein
VVSGEKPHKKLDVWKIAMDLVLDIYRITGNFPMEERYSLTDQMRRAAVSVPSNIAEGAARNTKKEFANFLYMAQGSLSELDTQLEIASKLGYLKLNGFEDLEVKVDRIGRMITGLIKNLRDRES